MTEDERVAWWQIRSHNQAVDEFQQLIDELLVTEKT
jgi:DNA-binding transcriptional regulator of glucitol operon